MLFDCTHEINPYVCVRCANFQTNFSTILRAHVVGGHTQQNPNAMVYKCLKCQFDTLSKYVAVKHSLRCAAAHRYNDNEACKWFKCELCLFRARKERGLIVHMSQKHEDSQIQYFYYEQCSAKFRRKRSGKRSFT
ncbi:hypothetical protein Zmor_027860 [Zophobas morio]|uniref:C2H2-type domain-containing protein n=1 Tax=Zophobas morio TaxID=2755281 RepID=A0AA38M3D9_9CUCU|nr:hypothetical protein Zmor_027860 [Zophobas morio]